MSVVKKRRNDWPNVDNFGRETNAESLKAVARAAVHVAPPHEQPVLVGVGRLAAEPPLGCSFFAYDSTERAVIFQATRQKLLVKKIV